MNALKLMFVAVLVAGCSKTHAPDNTSRNGDPIHAVNGDQAAQSGTDLDLTAKIRKALVADDTLSTNAHNAKIVVANGVATLAGPVASDTEKAKVMKLAADAGASSVIDHLEIVDTTATK